jgi:hypothetical protein
MVIVMMMISIMVPISDEDDVQVVDEAAELFKRRRVNGDGTGAGLKDAGHKRGRHGRSNKPPLSC